MFLRVFFVVFLLIFCTSCDYFPLSKKQQLPSLDTIINFNEVDFSPSFAVCDSLIDKQVKSACFSENMHQKIGEELQKQVFTIKDSINEMVTVHLLIDNKGIIKLEKIEASQTLKGNSFNAINLKHLQNI